MCKIEKHQQGPQQHPGLPKIEEHQTNNQWHLFPHTCPAVPYASYESIVECSVFRSMCVSHSVHRRGRCWAGISVQGAPLFRESLSGGSLSRSVCVWRVSIQGTLSRGCLDRIPPPPVATAMVKVQTYFGSQYFVIDHHCKNRSESLDIVTFVGIG